jgi:hypothetical protein
MQTIDQELYIFFLMEVKSSTITSVTNKFSP